MGVIPDNIGPIGDKTSEFVVASSIGETNEEKGIGYIIIKMRRTPVSRHYTIILIVIVSSSYI